jgi:hypothetical protein
MEKDEALEILRKIKNSTNSNGYNLVICLSNEDSLFSNDKFFPTLTELKDIYSEWKIVDFISGKSEIEINGGGEEHFHDMIFGLFRKE